MRSWLLNQRRYAMPQTRQTPIDTSQLLNPDLLLQRSKIRRNLEFLRPSQIHNPQRRRPPLTLHRYLEYRMWTWTLRISMSRACRTILQTNHQVMNGLLDTRYLDCYQIGDWYLTVFRLADIQRTSTLFVIQVVNLLVVDLIEWYPHSLLMSTLYGLHNHL